MERAATLQRFLLGVQIADLILKVCLFVALIVLVIIAISYLKQRKRIELEYHKKKMSEEKTHVDVFKKEIDDTLFAKRDEDDLE